MSYYQYSILFFLVLFQCFVVQANELSLEGIQVKVEDEDGISVKGIHASTLEFRPVGEASLLNSSDLPEDWEVIRQSGQGVVWSWVPLATGGFVKVAIPSFVLVPKQDNTTTFKISEPVIVQEGNKKDLMMNVLNHQAKILEQHEKELEQMATHLEQLLSSFK